jgi:amino acid transporter
MKKDLAHWLLIQVFKFNFIQRGINMENLQNLQLAIPLWEIVLLGIVCLLCLISDKLKLGLLATFVFVFYWGLVTTFSEDGSPVIGFQAFEAIYLFIGISLSMIFLVFLIFSPNE